MLHEVVAAKGHADSLPALAKKMDPLSLGPVIRELLGSSLPRLKAFKLSQLGVWHHVGMISKHAARCVDPGHLGFEP